MKLTVFAFIVILASCLESQLDEIQIGKRLPNDAGIIDSSRFLQLTNASSLLPAIKIRHKEIMYNVVLSKDETVSYVITFDPFFETNDGFHVGMPFKQLRDKLEGSGQFEPGFGYSIKLKSGWNAFFSNDKILLEGKVQDTAKIKSFFKTK
jgi:hypothetical protein